MSTKKKTRRAAPGATSPGLGFERVKHIPGSTYKDASTVVIIPTRSIAAEVEKKRRAKKEGTVFDEKDIEVFGIDQRVISAWRGMLSPMNQQRAELFASGHEVGQAYNDMIAQVLAHPQLKKFKYVLTLEDDNIPPPDAHIRLLESIEQFKFDAVSGIYFTKGEINMPMAYGDPAEYARTGVLDFKPRDIRDALAAGHVMPVNGIAMGCALWRMDLFREIPGPWYVTVNDVVPGKGSQMYTQDLSFAERAVRLGKRFGVDMRVRVGHLDVRSGTIF